MKQILKVTVGSQAHGLANKNSDFDYRGVFLIPTLDFFQLGQKELQHTSWIEGKEDDTSWEVGKFLQMAVKCNPTVLETFLAPVKESDIWGDELRDLFPYVWNSKDVMNAFVGYGVNQRKKFFDNQDKRAPKYATAYLRVLYNAWELLSTGTFSVDMTNTPIFEDLKRFKAGKYGVGEVIQKCFDMETKVIKAYKQNPDKQTDLEPINQYISELRASNL